MFGQSLLSGAFGSAFDPGKHFNTVIYTGNDTARAITTGFQPDFTWIKSRTNTSSHSLFDSIRGADQWMTSNGTNTDTSAPYSLTSFDANGFSLGTDSGQWGVNESPNDYVSWSWKGGGTAVSNTDGGITSQVSVNVDAGFSVVNYLTNGAATFTAGHGLSQAPELWIIKSTTYAYGWETLYPDTFTTAGSSNPADWNRLYLNDDASSASLGNTYLAADATLLYNGGWGATSYGMIAYCWHSVAGYSKIGTYTATQTAGSPTITTDFEPRWLLVKNVDRTQEWVLVDSVRGNNPGESLIPNSNSAESSSNSVIFTSTGFTINTTGQGNNYATGDKMLYMAFA